jgi:hypothetical protein
MEPAERNEFMKMVEKFSVEELKEKKKGYKKRQT